jgi:hypothetical protein
MELGARLTKLQRYSQATSFSTISCSLDIKDKKDKILHRDHRESALSVHCCLSGRYFGHTSL